MAGVAADHWANLDEACAQAIEVARRIEPVPDDVAVYKAGRMLAWHRKSSVRIDVMLGRPLPNEAASNYFKYIDKVSGDDALLAMRSQLDESMKLFSAITEEKSLHKYAPEKWTIRQVLNHVSDTERAFAYRTLWFARGFDTALAGYDPDAAAAGAQANEISWSSHVEEFQHVRNATISLFQNLSPEAWMRTGMASGKLFTVRAIAFLVSGHAAHHFEILEKKYLA